MGAEVDNLITQIKAYLCDQTYNYAILLNGGWGIGKTFFVKEKLIPSLEQDKLDYHIKYVSLYGCNSRERVRSAIIEKIIADCIASIDITEHLTKKSYVTKKEEQKKALMVGGVFIKKAAMAFLSNWGFDLANLSDLSDAVAEIVDLKDYFIIVDDIERCLCSPDEILGALNEIVEHEEAKMLLVTNEAEIGGYNVDNNIELKYVLAANNDIKVAEHNRGSVQKELERERSFAVERLRERAQSIFDNEQLTYRYKKIREKLIGVTLEYKPRLSDVMHIIIDSVSINEVLKNIMHSQVGMYEEYMGYYGHRNLRTFQFFISRASFLFDRCSDLNLTKKEKSFIFPDIVKESFFASLAYKAAISKKDVDIEHTIDCTFDFVEVYVNEGQIVYEDLLPILRSYSKRHYANRIPENDDFSELVRDFAIKDDEWIIDKLQKVYEHLKKDDYPIERYGDILYFIIFLETIGFEKSCLEKYKQCMKNNICKKTSVAHLIQMPNFLNLDENHRKTIKDIIVELNNLANGQNRWNNGLSIKKILDDNDKWLTGLEDYFNNKEYEVNELLFTQNSIKIIHKRISEASKEELVQFYRLLQRYEKKYSPSQEEMKNIIKLINKIDKAKNDICMGDKIKKFDLQMICNILKKMSCNT